jgi:hypothetical protein
VEGSKLDEAFKTQSLPETLHLSITGSQGASVAALVGLTAACHAIKLPLASWGSRSGGEQRHGLPCERDLPDARHPTPPTIDPEGLIDVSGPLPESTAAAAVTLDVPQGLARVGHDIRACEKVRAPAGKTRFVSGKF